MEHLDPVMVDVNMLKIIKVLQHIMAGVIQHVGAGMAFDAIQKHLKGNAVVQVFAGVNLVAQIDTTGVGMVQKRRPAAGEFVKSLFDQTGGALRPRVKIRPGQRTRKRRLCREAKVFRG
ncbi:MAG: hypothetical protein ACD_54C01258G0001 [uncultured bacterium]|nr:MAG: hypothetical protein ACD_54C01258G0001 [uncultured bacterium]